MKLRTWCLGALATVTLIASIGCRSVATHEGSATLASRDDSAGGAFLGCNLRSSPSKKSEFKWLGGSKVELYGKEFDVEKMDLFQKNEGFTNFGAMSWTLTLKGKFQKKKSSMISFNLPLEEKGSDPVVIFHDQEFQMQDGSGPQNSCVGAQVVNFAAIDQMVAANKGRTPQLNALTTYKFTNGKLWDCFVTNRSDALDLVSWTGANLLSFDREISGGTEIKTDHTGIKSAPVVNAAMSRVGNTDVLKFVAITANHRYYGELAVADTVNASPSSVLTIWTGASSQDRNLVPSSGATMKKKECRNPSSSFNRRIARDFTSQFGN